MSSLPPQDPTTTTTAAATATADFLKSVTRQRPRKHLHPSIYQTFHNPQPTTTAAFPPPTQQSLHSNSRTRHQQSPAVGVFYPVSSSGRGFLSKHQQSNSDQNAEVGVIPNSDGFPPRPVSDYPYAVHRPYGISNSDASGPTSHQLVAPSSGHMPNFATGVPVPANLKVVGQSSVADDKGLKHTRDNGGDDTFVIIRDRKVQVSEGTTLYAQCRSWLKNGITMEHQPQYVDCVNPLPKPLPAPVVESRKEDVMEIDEEIKDVEHLSAKELLQQHVKHAKKVRARLMNRRLQRIERFKDRLALLLAPVVDPQPKNDPAA